MKVNIMETTPAEKFSIVTSFLFLVVAGAEAPNVNGNGDPAAAAVVVDGWALKEKEGFGASKVAALVTAGAPEEAPKVGTDEL